MNTTHTHELRRNSYNSNRIPASALHTHVKGTEKDCYKYLENIAEEQKCGVGLLLNNGGWRIVCLEEERIEKIKEAAPELLEACIKLSEWNDKYPPNKVYSYDRAKVIESALTEIVEKAKQAIKKATE